MSFRRARSGEGFSFAEVLVTVFAVSVMSIPITLLLSSSRADTSKAINYLRALEIGYETIEWVQTLPFHSSSFKEFTAKESRSLNDQGTGGMVFYNTGDNPKWNSALTKKITYPEQYKIPYFFREIKIDDVAPSLEYGVYLKQVTVTVWWNEAQIPQKLDKPERMRKITLSTLLLDNSRGY